MAHHTPLYHREVVQKSLRINVPFNSTAPKKSIIDSGKVEMAFSTLKPKH